MPISEKGGLGACLLNFHVYSLAAFASKELGMREGKAVGLVPVSHLLLCLLVPWGRHGCSYVCASE